METIRSFRKSLSQNFCNVLQWRHILQGVLALVAFLSGLTSFTLWGITISPICLAVVFTTWCCEISPLLPCACAAIGCLFSSHADSLCSIALIAVIYGLTKKREVFSVEQRYLSCILAMLLPAPLLCEHTLSGILSYLIVICITILISTILFAPMLKLYRFACRQKIHPPFPFSKKDSPDAVGLCITPSTENIDNLAGVLAEISSLCCKDDFMKRQLEQISGCLKSAAKPIDELDTDMIRFHHRFDVNIGCASLAKGSNVVIGDSYTVYSKGNKLFTAISDGMGSGRRAERESTKTLSIISRLIDVGFDLENAAECVNRLLMSGGDGEMYATLDAVLFNLNTGRLSLVKHGAPPSYVLRGGKINTLYAEALPVGIIEDAQPAVCSLSMCSGDVIIMMSDGVSDALGMDLVASLTSCIASNTDPEAIAHAILDRAKGERAAQDDMTVVIAKIE